MHINDFSVIPTNTIIIKKHAKKEHVHDERLQK